MSLTKRIKEWLESDNPSLADAIVLLKEAHSELGILQEELEALREEEEEGDYFV